MLYETSQVPPDCPSTAAVKRRRRLGVSLRMLMLLVLGVGGSLGWICYRARVQREAVSAIERAGGAVQYDWQLDLYASTPRHAPTQLGTPGWLRRHLGPGFFEEVTWVSFFAKGQCELELDDTIMFDIGCLPRLQVLSVAKPNVVTDAGLANLKHLGDLKILNIVSRGLTNTGLVHLRDLRKLEYLQMVNTQITDLESLRNLSRLQELYLLGSRVDDTGLAPIEKLNRLRRLAFFDTGITDHGLARLAVLKQCRTIELEGTQVTVEGAAAMRAKCPWMTIILRPHGWSNQH
jgi:hypothetical protein